MLVGMCLCSYLSRFCCYIQSPGLVGHGGDTDLKEVVPWGLRTTPCSPLPSATWPFQQPLQRLLHPPPAQHSFPLTIWSQELRKDAAEEKGSCEPAPRRLCSLAPHSSWAHVE